MIKIFFFFYSCFSHLICSLYGHLHILAKGESLDFIFFFFFFFHVFIAYSIHNSIGSAILTMSVAFCSVKY